MKTSITLIPILSFALLAGTVSTLSVGCAGTATKASTGEYVDDTATTAKVKAEFVRDQVVKAGDVNVETFKGTVQLSGFVNTSEQKERAGKLAEAVPGVKEVKNNIQVK